MRVMHIALGGCLRPPPVAYGLTDDTGGHIAYVLGAATAAAARDDVTEVEIVTRAFDAPDLGPDYARPIQRIGTKLVIRRLRTTSPGYLDKSALAAELEDFSAALLDHLDAAAHRPDVIHAHFADAAEPAFAARRRFGIPVIYSAHSLACDGPGDFTEPDPERARRIAREGRALAQADAIVASSRDEAERQIPLYAGARDERIWRLRPGVEMAPATTISGAARLVAPFLRRPDLPPILAIARPVRKKNLPALVEMFGRSPSLRSRANLVIVAGLRDDLGSGSAEQRAVLQKIVAEIDRHDLYGQVALPRRHAPRHVAELYRWATERRGVFCNPATTEPFGLTLLEAAAAGLPVVATTRGGPVDIIGDIGHGRTADPADPGAFAAEIAALLTDERAWDAAHAAANRAAPHLGWRSYAARHAALCRDLLAPKVPARRDPTRLFVSDIDNTLTGDRRAAEAFARWRRSTAGMTFAIATGRSMPEARVILAAWDLPEPDAFITSVGSEIYRRADDGTLKADAGFAAMIARGWRADDVLACVAALPGIVPQRAAEQRRFKRSFFCDGPDAADHARDALGRAGLPARIVFSHDRLLDILPARAGKAAAADWLRRRLGIGPDAWIAAGDSGNDLDLLAFSPRAIVVANHARELTPLAMHRHVYFARASFASGVLEGIDAWGGMPERPS